MLARVVAALIALVCLTSVAYGQQCQTVSAALAEATPIASKLGAVVTVLRGSEAEAYLQVVNDTPPIGDFHADGLIILSVPDKGATLALIQGGCVKIVARIGLDVHEKAMKAAKGTPA